MKQLSLKPSIRWNAGLKLLPALSIRQPFAWMIIHGFKDVENRSKRTHYRGPLLIHASMKVSDFYEEDAHFFEQTIGAKWPENGVDVDLGGIVGVADVVDCVRRHKSPWKDPSSWGWIVANPRPLPFRECKGAVGFFYPKL